MATTYYTDILGWSGNVDVALADFFANVAAAGDTLIVCGFYTTSLFNIDIPDNFTMRARSMKQHGFLRSGYAGSAPLFRIGNQFRAYGIKGEAEGWEDSDEPVVKLFRGEGKTNPKFVNLDIRGRDVGIMLIDCTAPQLWKSRIEGCKHGFWLQGLCPNAMVIANEITGGYLDPEDLQGEAVKTVRSTGNQGPINAIILYNRISTKRGAVDTTGGLKGARIAFNWMAVELDEALDFKSQYVSQAEIDAVVAAGTALSRNITTYGNTFYKCGVTCTTDYNTIASLSDGSIDASCVSDLTLGTAALPDLYIGDAVENVVMLRDYASRRITVRARTSGRMEPYKRLVTGTVQPIPKDIAFTVLWDGEWRASVSIYATNFAFAFLSGSIVRDTTGALTMFTAQGTDGITLSGTATKAPSATGAFTTLNNTTNPATNVTNTMSIAA